MTKTKPKIMAIVNATPDSFSGDGVYAHTHTNIEYAITYALKQIKNGADILDIGGESTRPGAECIDASTESHRILPIIQAIRQVDKKIPISVDSYKAQVADIAIKAGANIINDVWGGTKDPHMLHIAKKHNCPICIMHNTTTVGAIRKTCTGTAYTATPYTATPYTATHSDTFLKQLLADLQALADNAIACGIKPENIIIDAGVGFGKTVQQNLQILKYTAHIKQLGYPVLLGASRKSFIGEVLHTQVDDRIIGTCATTAFAVQQGIDIVRVHDVIQTAQTITMTTAILQA